jgi:membrane-associated phospholipid phosphatase
VSRCFIAPALLLVPIVLPHAAYAQDVPVAAQPPPPAAPLVQPAERPGDAPKPEAEKPAEPAGPVRPAEPRHETAASLVARLEWRWPKFTPVEFGISLGMAGLAMGSLAIPGQTKWGTGGATNEFDRSARNALRLSDEEASLYARDASDVGLVLLINARLVDSLFVTWWYHDKGSTALQMALIDGQTIAFAAGIQSFTAAIVGRERPYVSAICESSPDKESGDCLSNNRTRSFFSGHSTLAFTLAALTCVHHINLPLYGGGPAEAVPCAATLAVASGVALLRVAGDQHYTTDIMTGAAFGTAVGFAVPYLFHYGWPLSVEKTPTLKAAGIESINLVPNPSGISIGGLF